MPVATSFAAACAAARPRLRASDELRAEPPSRRLAGFLVRRGFAPEVVAQAVRELLGKDGLVPWQRFELLGKEFETPPRRRAPPRGWVADGRVLIAH